MRPAFEPSADACVAQVLFETERQYEREEHAGEDIVEISSDAFVNVMLRYGLRDTDYAGFLARNPDAVGSFGLY